MTIGSDREQCLQHLLEAEARLVLYPPRGSRSGPLAGLLQRLLFRVLRPYSLAHLALQQEALASMHAAMESVPDVVMNDGSDVELPELRAQEDRDSRNIRRVLSATLRLDSNVVDIGAHNGGFLREVLRFAPEGQHIALEPLPHLADYLRAEFPRISVHCVAASDREGTAPFHHVVGCEPWSGLISRPLPGGGSA